MPKVNCYMLTFKLRAACYQGLSPAETAMNLAGAFNAKCEADPKHSSWSARTDKEYLVICANAAPSTATEICSVLSSLKIRIGKKEVGATPLFDSYETGFMIVGSDDVNRLEYENGFKVSEVTKATERLEAKIAEYTSLSADHSKLQKRFEELQKKYVFVSYQHESLLQKMQSQNNAEITLDVSVESNSAGSKSAQKVLNGDGLASALAYSMIRWQQFHETQIQKPAKRPRGRPKKIRGPTDQILALSGENLIDYIDRRAAELDKTCYGLADESTLGIASIDRIFGGETQRPRISTLQKLAPCLNTTAEYLSSLIPDDAPRPGKKAK